MAYQSRLVSHDLSDLGCPLSLSYRLTNGPSAGTGEATFRIERDPDNPAAGYLFSFPIGSTCHIQCDESHFYGYVVGTEESVNDSDGNEILKVSMVDWRDRLHDNLFFGAFNMLENNGYCWHILPVDWGEQIKTVVTRELEMQDFYDVQNVDPSQTPIKSVASETLVTSATLLNTIANLGGFNWIANWEILTLLSKNRPMNLDWRDGANYAEVIENILSKSGLQWTVQGPDTIRITRIGHSGSLAILGFLEWQIDMCNPGLDGWSSSRGVQLDESGTLIRIVGGMDKYQITYLCQPDWNILFDFQRCFDNYTLQLLLKKNGLFLTSKLGELPVEYHDDTPIESPTELGVVPGRKTRNDLTIEEYVEDICFKTYMVDPGNVSRYFNINVTDFINESGMYERFWDDYIIFPEQQVPLADYDWEARADRKAMSFTHEISSNLVTESRHRMIVHRTAYILSKNKTSPLQEKHYLSPGNQGVTLDLDTIVEKGTARLKHTARLRFSEPAWYIDDLEDWDSPTKVKSDRILVTLSFDRAIFNSLYGTNPAAAGVHQLNPNMRPPQLFRSREKKHDVSKLHRAYVDDEEVFVMAQSTRVRVNAGGQAPATQPVKADNIAESVAMSLISGEFDTPSGTMTRRNMASFNVDGIITSINVSFSGTEGLTESLVFGGTQNFINKNTLPPSIYRVSTIIPTTAKVNRERIEEQASVILTEAMELPKSISTRKSLAGSLKAATNIRFMSEFWRGINDSSDASVDMIIDPDDKNFDGSERGGVVIVEDGGL